MSEYRDIWSLLGLTMLSGTLGACTHSPEARQALALANPASVHCVRMGGESVLHQAASGQYSLCRFKDGTEIEEWRYYRQSFPHLY